MRGGRHFLEEAGRSGWSLRSFWDRRRDGFTQGHLVSRRRQTGAGDGEMGPDRQVSAAALHATHFAEGSTLNEIKLAG